MKPISRNRAARTGFSLIELLFTLLILAFLSSLLYSFGSARHQRTQKQLCGDNLQKIYLALQIYANDFGGRLPQNTNALTAEAALDVLVPRYSADTTIFICPGGRDSEIPAGESLLKRKISYAYFMGRRLATPPEVWLSDRQVDTQSKRTGDLAFSENGKSPGNNHHKYGGNFLLGDGSVQASPARLTFPLALPPGVVLLNPNP